MFGLNWLKPILRRKMKPIPQDRAKKALSTLTLTYVFLGWNFVSLLLYLTWKKSIPEGPEKVRKYAEVLNIDHAHVIKFSGLSKVSEYNIDRTEEVMQDTKRRRMVTDLHPPVNRQTQGLESENITEESSTSF
ncbi:uncharacterized protein LOC117173042 [Belonocnema kinseyi]|uniref:uncharacterized protein LOC117173042 n=1 Tax=Belonocnema kinseyi TaxID=2817044 RepID=UPI00143DABA2|nr:uncharacterized protein LOC117173042 [Belonocnema kinseyi]